MRPDDLLALFRDAARAVAEAVGEMTGAARSATSTRAGQYELDLVADDAALTILKRAGMRIVSEESGISGPADAPVTLVVDPVDGSTNCARGISYWATSICAVDHDGPLAALVVNQATGIHTTAVRGGGAFRDGLPLRPSGVRRIEDALVAVAGIPARLLPWNQYRALGCAALALCDVAAGAIDGYVDGGSFHAPWDYLGGWLCCLEAGAPVVDAAGESLATTVPDVRRQLVAAATPELLAALRPAAR